MKLNNLKGALLSTAVAFVSSVLTISAFAFPVFASGNVASGGNIPVPQPSTASGGNIPAPSNYLKPTDDTKLTIESSNGSFVNKNVDVNIAIQGEEAMKAFRSAIPSGASAVVTMNLSVDNENNYNRKVGTLKLNLGKNDTDVNYAVLFLDEKGTAHIYNDQDTDPDTITVNINVSGYAFMLVEYPSGSVIGNGTYVVKKGDTLSRIAASLNTTVQALAKQNNIQNPNYIRIGQSLKY